MYDVIKRYGTYLLLSLVFDDDTDGGELLFARGRFVLHADKLEVEQQFHAVVDERLQHHCPGVVVLLSTSVNHNR